MYPELWKIPIVNFGIKGYGFMLLIAFVSGTYLAAKRADKVRANPEVVFNCAILALIGSMVGARLFYVIHYWDTRFAPLQHPLRTVFDISSGGMEFYGGVAGGMIMIIGYLVIKGHSIRLYFDILTPSMMLGLAITRIGCFLNGCCWGAVCVGTIAEPWAVQFPYASPAYHRQHEQGLIQVPAELQRANAAGRMVLMLRDDAALEKPELAEIARRQRTLPVHATQLYAAINALLGAVFLSWVLRWRRRHGMVFAVWLLTYPWTRIILENIRVDNPRDTFGLTVSSALSIAMIAAGLVLALWFYKTPPAPVPAPVPPPARQAGRSKKKSKRRTR